jgi:POT family proton-dependent oligopeptide transporter
MLIYIIGLAILSVTSLPSSIEAGLALPGLLISMVFIGIGGGGIKANVSALIAEQYTETKPFVRITKSGKKVIVDPPMTITRIFSIFCQSRHCPKPLNQHSAPQRLSHDQNR